MSDIRVYVPLDGGVCQAPAARPTRYWHSGCFYRSGSVVLVIGGQNTSEAWRVLLAHEIAHAGHPFAVAHGRPWRRSFVALLAAAVDGDGQGAGAGAGAEAEAGPDGWAWPKTAAGRDVSYVKACAIYDERVRNRPETGAPWRPLPVPVPPPRP